MNSIPPPHINSSVKWNALERAGIRLARPLASHKTDQRFVLCFIGIKLFLWEGRRGDSGHPLHTNNNILFTSYCLVIPNRKGRSDVTTISLLKIWGNWSWGFTNCGYWLLGGHFYACHRVWRTGRCKIPNIKFPAELVQIVGWVLLTRFLIFGISTGVQFSPHVFQYWYCIGDQGKCWSLQDSNFSGDSVSN